MRPRRPSSMRAVVVQEVGRVSGARTTIDASVIRAPDTGDLLVRVGIFAVDDRAGKSMIVGPRQLRLLLAILEEAGHVAFDIGDEDDDAPARPATPRPRRARDLVQHAPGKPRGRCSP